jgi:hypothetical protein
MEVKSTGRFGVHDLASTVNGMIKSNRINDDDSCDVYSVRLAIAVGANMHMCIYICIYIIMFTYSYLYTYLYIRTYVYECVHKGVNIWTHMYT